MRKLIFILFVLTSLKSTAQFIISGGTSAGAVQGAGVYTTVTTLSEITSAGAGAELEIRGDIVLTANYQPPANQVWRFTTGSIDADTFTLTGDNTTVFFNQKEKGLDLFSGTLAGTWVAPEQFYWENVGGLYDYVKVTDGAITTGTATLTSATAGFTASDVGKYIAVAGAGAAGSNASTLITTISGYTNATTVTLAANAVSTVTGADVIMASDNYNLGRQALYLRNQNSGTLAFSQASTAATVVERANSDTGINNYLGWRIGDGTDHITLKGNGVSMFVLPNSTTRSDLFTLFDTDYYVIEGFKFTGDYDYHPNSTEFPSIINIGTAAYNGRIVDCDITKSIGDGLVTTADSQFQTFRDQTFFSTGNIDDSGTIQTGETEWLYSQLINVDTGDFTASATKRGFRYFALTGTSLGGWGGLTRPDYYVAYYDAGGTFIEKSPKLQFYSQVRLEDDWKQLRILIEDVETPSLIDIQLRPSLHARGLYMNNVNVSFCGRQGASNLPYDTTWEHSNIFENGDISPGAGIDIEDERRSAENYVFRGLRMWNNFGGDILLINARNVVVNECQFLPNTKPLWNVQGNNTSWAAGVGGGSTSGRNVTVTNSVFYDRGVTLDRNAVIKDNIFRGGSVRIYGNSCTVENNDFYNAKLKVDHLGSGNRERSIVRDNMFSWDQMWVDEILEDRNMSADWTNNRVRLNDISRLSNLATYAATGINNDFDAADTDKGLFTRLSPGGTSGWLDGKFKDFYFEGIHRSDTIVGDDGTRFTLPVTDFDGLYFEGPFEFLNGEEQDILIQNFDIKGYIQFNLTNWSGVLSSPSTITMKNGTVYIEDANYAWTNAGAALIETEAKNANFVFENVHFKINLTYTGQKMIRLGHLGTTTFKNCTFETLSAQTLDFTNGGTKEGTTGAVTIIDPTLINVTLTPDTGEHVLYTRPDTNLPVYADNAAAIADGYPAGYLYRTSTGSVLMRY